MRTSVQFGSLRFESVHFDTIRFGSDSSKSSDEQKRKF
jgi:hypothetical protein